MTVGELSYWDTLGYTARHPLPWFCWLPALSVFLISRSHTLRDHAPGLMLTTLRLTALITVLGLMLSISSIADGGCTTFCRELPRWCLMWMQILWIPVILVAIPVLLQAPRGHFDRSFRRTACITLAAMIDVLLCGFTLFGALAAACPSDHGIGIIVEWGP